MMTFIDGEPLKASLLLRGPTIVVWTDILSVSGLLKTTQTTA